VFRFCFGLTAAQGKIMAESVTLVTEPREGRGTSKARRLRRSGKIPAVVYGHEEGTVSISVSADELQSAIRHNARVVDLKTGNDLQKALIRDLQWDHLGKDLLHADFERVAADERVVVPVRIELRGIAPGVTAGGLLDQPIHTIEVECLATAVPDTIRVNINELQLGGAIHIRELKLPEGVVAKDDPDAIVVHVVAKQAEPEAGVAVPAAEQAEPEVIGRQAKTEEEEGE
jgi:large subunit ribosomal protein L25